MTARKDLLKAQAFITQRLVSALVDRDPDNAVAPLRRLGMATFVGILAAVILLAGFGIVGFLNKPTTQAWQKANTIVIDTTAGAVFVYLEHPNEPDPDKRMQLHPVPNITSAKLITKGGEVFSVKTASLANAVRGQAYGILTAPSQLPDPKDMSAFPLRVCSIPTDFDQSHKPRSRATTLEIGVAPAPTRNDTIAAVDSAGTEYLIMGGRRYMLPKTTSGKSPLLNGAYTLDLRVDSWLESIPVQPPLEALTIPGMGNKPTKPEVGNIGRLVSTGDVKQPQLLTYWVLLNDGYTKIGYLDMRLLVMKYSREPINVADREIQSYTSKTNLDSPLPTEPPRFYQDGQGFGESNVCATYTQGRPFPAIEVDSPQVPTPPKPTAPPKEGSGQAETYDLIVGLPGGGALVRNAESLAAGGGAQLIWQNRRYGIPDAESRNALGYGDKPAVAPIWGGILRRIPAGLPNGILLSHDVAASTMV